MSIAQDFLAELDYELPATRKVLERVPIERTTWKPHPKSSALGPLAQFVATMPRILADIVRGKSLDLAEPRRDPPTTTEDLLGVFDRNVQRAREALQRADDPVFALEWTMVYGSEVIDTSRRKDVLRNTINHLVHHRAQLTVYLRLNDVAVPQLYGPTADEK